jgi:hypothetical protein
MLIHGSEKSLAVTAAPILEINSCIVTSHRTSNGKGSAIQGQNRGGGLIR